MRQGLRRIFTSGALVPGLFLALVLLGVVVHDDFGITWDEPDYYRYGDLVVSDVASGTRQSEEFANLRFYGPVVPVAHSWLRALVQPSPEEVFPLAHLLNYLIFLGGAAAFYALARRMLGSRGWALAGTAALVLSPRIFSHAFVNPKDAPFMALFIVNIWLLVTYLETRRWQLIPLLALATALLVDIRAPGIVVAAMTLATLSLDAGLAEGPVRARLGQVAGPMLLYVLIAAPLVVLMWPFLWSDPPGHFAEALALMASFEGGPQVTAYLGELVGTSALPWHYVPVWIGITTPPAYLALAGVGLLYKLGRRPITLFRDRSVQRHWFLLAGWLLAPPVFLAMADARLYDAWRQVLFVYPPLVLFAAAGGQRILQGLAHNRFLQRACVAALLAIGASVAAQMAVLHPYQAVYFNALIAGGEGAEGRFELDYWGASYPAGLRFLLEEIPEGPVRLHVCTHPGRINAFLFEQRNRLEYVEVEEADFGVCAPRDEWLALPDQPGYLAEHPTIFSLSRDGATFLYVKDLRDG